MIAARVGAFAVVLLCVAGPLDCRQPDHVTHDQVLERLREMETLTRIQQEDNTRMRTLIEQQSREGLKMAAQIQAQNDVINRLQANKLAKRQTDEGGVEEGGMGAMISQLQQQVVQNTADIQATRQCACPDGNGDGGDALTPADSGATSGSGSGSGSGSTYVHWGSSTCGAGASLVYSGLAGGSYWAHSGGAATTLCLTKDPVFAPRQVPVTYYANLYGAEYETHDEKQNHDVLCAVCSASQPSTIMVPGTNVCPTGWTQQYQGYLMSGHWSQAGASDYICVDAALEARTGSSQNTDGHSLFFTASRCGALPCAPYQENKVVTCAVCSN